MKDIKPNMLQMTPAGCRVDAVKSKCGEGALDVRRGYLWTPKLKSVVSTTYQPSDKDENRPKHSIYADVKAAVPEEEFSILFATLRGN